MASNTTSATAASAYGGFEREEDEACVGSSVLPEYAPRLTGERGGLGKGGISSPSSIGVYWGGGE
jgi:hypothetical protein